MPRDTQQQRADRAIRQAGTTYAEEAGIRLADTPAPLYQLLVLCSLLAKPISADLATAAARELKRSGLSTPRKMRQATWQQRVDALGRGHYRRYDESTATILGEAADLLLERYRGDVRRLAEPAGHDVEALAEALQEVPGIGPTGASIYLREVQGVWGWVAPYVDDRVRDGAKKLRLPTSTGRLSALAGRRSERLAAALVRASLDDDLAATIDRGEHGS